MTATVASRRLLQSRGLAAVYRERGAGDESSLIRTQEGHDTTEVLRPSQRPDGDARRCRLAGPAVHLGDAVGRVQAGLHGVDRHAVPRNLGREGLEEPGDAGSNADSGVDAKSPGGGPPALGTKMSIPPSSRRASATKRLAPSGVDTSATIGTALGPSSRAAAARRRSSRPQIATVAPASTSAAAVARPSPADDPATAARLPLIPRSMAAP